MVSGRARLPASRPPLPETPPDFAELQLTVRPPFPAGSWHLVSGRGAGRQNWGDGGDRTYPPVLSPQVVSVNGLAPRCVIRQHNTHPIRAKTAEEMCPLRRTLRNRTGFLLKGLTVQPILQSRVEQGFKGLSTSLCFGHELFFQCRRHLKNGAHTMSVSVLPRAVKCPPRTPNASSH